MINTRLFIVSARNFLNNQWLTRGNFLNLRREYSVFPTHYIKPIFRKDDQDTLFQSEEAKKVSHEQIKPAFMDETSSEFYDARVIKFINTLMKNGARDLTTQLVTKTFENVKRMQIEQYHKAKTDEEKASIELNPFTIFHQAVDNCTPVLYLIPCKKGGITYQVPVPITPMRAQHTAMKWLIEAAKEKDRKIRFHVTLAKELIAASRNQGRAVGQKKELHKKCQANRAYAHFRWM
ncbi:28S ribosomal protein S7, mitochondrial [Ooceraea biroi]|uniref:28S ribosomal protein S7, mitochondrial n=1 Tax=Ooceraea biroi TaxID=2015173 RepID=A0A026WNC3_OOCBI|nr:28S ribosomal protein S7, mitochondrial [Ooceraea biroi]EZA57473.1 28S ribosomal protein S7, mitochondrial [Ooceraea biroi]